MMPNTILDPMVPMKMKISQISRETNDVFTIKVEPGDEGFRFKPGQFNMLYGYGTGEAAISICSDSSNTGSFMHTIHKVGYVTGYISRLKAGDVIGVRGPFGSNWPVHEAEGKDVCIIAGGIGLAPLRPMIYHIFNNRKKFGRINILYGARTPNDLLYSTELEAWSKKQNVNVEITVDRADSSWKGHVGVVTTIIDYAQLKPLNTIAMVCGPELMMNFCIDELLTLGFTESSVYLSMERNMKCALGFCGHCQFGHNFICKDGPVFNYGYIKNIFDVQEF